MADYIVTAPAVVVYGEKGEQRGPFYKESPLPEDLRDGEIERLLEIGMIAEVDTDGQVKRPTARAGVEKWRKYALATGHTEDELDGIDKDAIVALVDADNEPS